MLSAVHRLGGRFGRGRVADHLTGKTKEPAQFETTLSTFGIGRDVSASAWRQLIDQFLFEGLLREDPNDGRPLIALGEPEQVRAVYRAERRVQVRNAPKTEEKSGSGRASRSRKRYSGERLGIEAADAPLFETLRNWRRERAAEQHVPPYVIFHDVTLSAIARERPKSLDALAKISGVGQSKLKRYGEDVLRIVREA